MGTGARSMGGSVPRHSCRTAKLTRAAPMCPTLMGCLGDRGAMWNRSWRTAKLRGGFAHPWSTMTARSVAKRVLAAKAHEVQGYTAQLHKAQQAAESALDM